MMKEEYLFKSKRLGFREWRPADIEVMTEINSDPLVMEFFPSIRSKIETIEFINKMTDHFIRLGHCYYAVEKLESNDFIGFIGLSEQTFNSDFSPCIDLGWRLKSSEWNKGYATEGAKECLNYGFNFLGISKINAISPKINIKSEYIMKKIGMKKINEFKHPDLVQFPNLQDCLIYETDNESFTSVRNSFKKT